MANDQDIMISITVPIQKGKNIDVFLDKRVWKCNIVYNH